MSHTTTTRATRRRRIPLAGLLALVALLALAGAACQPVAPLGAGSYADPVGSLDRVTGGPGTVRVTGWAAEWYHVPQDQWEWQYHNSAMGPQHGPAPTKIAVMVDGRWVPELFVADAARPDVDRAFLATGETDYRRPGSPYGFDATVPADHGKVSVCVVALNTMYRMATPENWHTGGDHVLLGCRTVTVG